MQSFDDILKYLFPLLTQIIIGAILIFRMFSDRKSKEKKDTDRDNEQDKRFDSIEKSVNDTAESLSRVILTVENLQVTNSRIENDVKEQTILHKYEKLHKELNAQIKTAINANLMLKKCDNDEIQQALFSAAKNFKSIISDILETDFLDCDPLMMIQRLRIEAKTVKTGVNWLGFGIDNVETFGHELSDFLLSKFEVFARDLYDISINFENGERRGEFKKLVLNLTNDISIGTINIFERYPKRK